MVSQQATLPRVGQSPPAYVTKVKNSENDWWYERYPEWCSPYAQIVTARNNAALGLMSGGERLLDIGCGFGDMLFLTGDRYQEKHGVDPAQVMVDKALANMRKHDLLESCFVKEGVAESLPFDSETFDTITMLDVMEHVEPATRHSALQEAYRVLKPDGELILATPSRHIIQFWNLVNNILSVPERILRRQPLRIWSLVEKGFTEEFVTSSELFSLIDDGQFEVEHFERVCFYPAPETVGFLGSWLHYSYRIPFLHQTITRVFQLIAKGRILNQKMLIRCRKQPAGQA